VVTVHDLAVLRHPGAFNPWTRSYSRALVARVVRAAQRVIAVSEFTKRELMEVLALPESRIRVIPNAVGEPFVPEGARADGEYVLAVGTREPRKNLPRLVQAARLSGVELRVAGAPGWGNADNLGDGIRVLGFVDDDELARLYRGALCFAYPSLYEGFGLPVLEALACGAPVVTSAGTAMAEVADGAAVLVDPEDPAAIAGGIREAVARRDELAALGPKRAAGFTWQAAAEATAAVYLELT
jgi:glycosyltransferase involved in cell wall biosynthesis